MDPGSTRTETIGIRVIKAAGSSFCIPSILAKRALGSREGLGAGSAEVFEDDAVVDILNRVYTVSVIDLREAWGVRTELNTLLKLI